MRQISFAEQFACHGICSDRTQIYSLVDEIRAATNADVAVLLPFCGIDVYRSLIMVAAKSATLQGALLTELTKRSDLNQLRDFEPIADLVRLDCTASFDSVRKIPVLRNFSPLTHSHPDSLVSLRSVSKLGGFSAAANSIVVTVGGDNSNVADQLWSRLATSVNCSSPVVFDRIRKASASPLVAALEVAKQRWDNFVTPNSDPQLMAEFGVLKAMLPSIAELLHACGGALYVRHPEEPNLLLKKFSVGEDVEFEKNYRLTVKSRRQTLVCRAFDREHIIYFPELESTDDFSDDPLVVRNELSSVVALPVISEIKGAAYSSVQAVLVLVKTDKKNVRPFSVYNLLGVREALAYSSNIEAVLRHVMTASAISGFLQHHQSTSEVVDDWSLSGNTSNDDTLFPQELRAIDPNVASILENILSITNASSISIRLLSSNGRLLRRIWAHPAENLRSPKMDLRLDEQSVNAWVAKTGKHIQLDDCSSSAEIHSATGSRESYCDVLRGTKSELCIPIYVDRRVVGTLNVESKIVAGLSSSWAVFASLANVVSYSYSNRRRATESEIYDCGSSLVLGLHEVGKARDKLADIHKIVEGATKSLSPVSVKEIAVLAEQATTRLDGVSWGSVESENLPQVDRSVPQFVDILHEISCHERFSKRFSLSKSDDLSCFYDDAYKIPHIVASKATIAFSEICDNAFKRHERSDPGDQISVLISENKIGGIVYLRVSVTNGQFRKLDRGFVNDMFRRPLEKNHYGERRQRPGLGCFIAGAIMRQIGGDASVVGNSPNAFTAAIDIPTSRCTNA